MRELGRLFGIVTVASVLVWSAAVLASTQTKQPKQDGPPNPDALVLQDFQKRIERYMDLHKELEGEAPPMKETEDPEKIVASQKALAAKIQAARRNARQGEIFTPAIRTKFRQLMYPETTGTSGRETKEVMKADAPTKIDIKVNGEYPQKQPLPTVPANVLAALPRLPEDLEYRVVGKHLILRDVHANLIVDFIPNAIQ